MLEKYGPKLLKGTVGSAKAAAPASSHGNYEAVKKDIVSILKKPEWDDGNLGPVLVRLGRREGEEVGCLCKRMLTIILI